MEYKQIAVCWCVDYVVTIYAERSGLLCPRKGKEVMIVVSFNVLFWPSGGRAETNLYTFYKASFVM
jgi:hypothetical protein